MTGSVLVVVAGEPGSGKDRFAKLVSKRTGARLVEAVSGAFKPGLEPSELPETDEYRALLAQARLALEAGECVVLAAPFHLAGARRDLMRMASQVRCALLYIECNANEVVRRRRVRDRLNARLDDPKEVAEVLDRVIALGGLGEPVRSEIPRACQMAIDTTVGIDLWAGLAAGRVEAYVAQGKAAAEAAGVAALSAG